MSEHLCEICGEPMPKGEEMFRYHGYSCPCPVPPKEKEITTLEEYLKNKLDKGITNHTISVHSFGLTKTLIIHPQGYDGTCYEFVVNGNNLEFLRKQGGE